MKKYFSFFDPKKILLFPGIFILFSLSLHGQLVINEVSQGPSGSKEYVELVVTGTPSCAGIPCVDLRGWYIDDNNGNHAVGAGTGIAQGCIRFSQDPLWSCVPAGEIIVIYNDADLNASVPAIDLSLTDGNCRLIIPVSNCALIEKNNSQPSTALATYPTTGFTSCGSWTNVSMANTDDSFQTINPAGTLVHSVSWGNNTLSPIIYFAGSSAGMVAWCNNAVNTNPSLQGNWVRTGVAGNETPGVPNNAANAAWINSMNNNCTPYVPLAAGISSTNASCSCTGTATVTPSGGTFPYTYSWAPAGGTNATATGLCAGSYTCTVTDAIGCIQVVNINVIGAATLTLSGTSANITCYGACNGTATTNITVGTGPFTYAWSPLGGTNATATGLCPGTYTCTVTDASGCTATQTFLITQPSAPLTASPSQTDLTCNGVNTGSASVVASGGTSVYTYNWTPTGGNSASASNLFAGNYSCTITDQNGCTFTSSFSITEPSALAVALSSTPATCTNADGSVTATPSGGTGSYTYVWSPGAYTTSSVNNIVSGNYAVIVTDQNGCTINGTVTVSNLSNVVASVSSQVNVNCFGQSTGAIFITQSGGNPGYTYSWSPNISAGDSAIAIAAGNYQVTVTDASGCAATVSVNVTQPPQLTLAATSNPGGVCSGSSVQLNATPAGGTPNYTVTWNPGNLSGNNQTIVPNASATYTANVVDQNGCSVSSPVNVTVYPTPSAAFNNDIASGCAPVCVNFSDTSTSASAIASWDWDFGDNTTSSLQNPVHCYYTSGIYDVTLKIISVDGCMSTLIIPNCINVFPQPVAGFTASPQPATVLNPQLFFTDTSLNATSWNWNFGDVFNSSSTLQNPTFTYTDPVCYQVTLAVSNAFGCNDTATQEVCINPEVTLFIPNAFTPNGDGNNDIFIPKGDGLTDYEYELLIFDRWGNLIFQSHALNDGWDGRVQGHTEISQEDTYVWKLQVTDINFQQYYLTGHINLIK